MMRQRTLKIIAVLLAVIAGLAAIAGYDAVFERNITDTFFSQDSHSDEIKY